MTLSSIQKKTLKVVLTDIDAKFSFFMFAVWPPHASLLPKVRLRFKVRELCSSLGIVTHSFCLTNIRSRFRTKSRRTFFSSSSLSSLQGCSFDLSVVDEEPVLAAGTFSFGIVVFLKFASFGVSSFCFGTSTFVLDESSTSTSLSKSSNFNFPSLIKSRTLRLSPVQFSVG